MRRTGNTFRLLLKSLEVASREDNSRILVIFANDMARTHALTMAMSMINPVLEGFVHYHYNSSELRFANGSMIKFVTPGYIEECRWIGISWIMALVDGSMDEINKSDRYYAAQSELVAYVRRNREYQESPGK